MRDIWKQLFSNEYDYLDRDMSRKIGIFGNVFFALISAVLSVMNIIFAYWFMAMTTIILVLGFLAACFLAYRRLLNPSHIISAFLCAFIFSVYAIVGGNDGFAILWIVLIPAVSSLLVGLRISLCLDIYFQIFLIVLFWTPLSSLVESFYSSTFMMRFPILYFAAFGATTFIMCQRQLLYNMVNHAASHDALTDLNNRRYYLEIVRRCEKDPEYNRMSITNVDINGLKFVNDTIGHEAGDEIIKATSDILNECFAPDECFRLGGDEFIVISSRSSDEITSDIEDLRKRVSSWTGEFVKELTISIGVASRETRQERDFAELSRTAELSMYEEKGEYYKRSGIDKRIK